MLQIIVDTYVLFLKQFYYKLNRINNTRFWQLIIIVGVIQELTRSIVSRNVLRVAFV